MGYAVLHLLKPKGASSSMSAHIERKTAPNNANPERTHLNRELIEFPDKVSSRTEAIQHRINTSGLQRKIGKNQIMAFNVLLSGSNEDMKRLESTGRLNDWCNDNLHWLRKTYGRENVVSAVLHLDETTPHIHATVVPIVTTERRKKKSEENVKKRYRKKSPNATRLCLDEIMSREKLKEYQNTYAFAMSKYGLQRGVKGSDARHISTSEYYRELINQTETEKRKLSHLEQQQNDVQDKIAKVKSDVSRENLKNSAADVGSKLIDGVNSLLGTPKMRKVELNNQELKRTIQSLNKENQQMRQGVEVIKSDAIKEIKNLEAQFKRRELELFNDKQELKSTLKKVFELFPQIKELLIFEKFCRAVGFGTEMIRRLFNREEVGFKGELYSHEYNRKFHTDHSVAKVEPNPTEPTKYQLKIDGHEIYTWFRLMHKEVTQSMGINFNQRQRNGRKL